MDLMLGTDAEKFIKEFYREQIIKLNNIQEEINCKRILSLHFKQFISNGFSFLWINAFYINGNVEEAKNLLYQFSLLNQSNNYDKHLWTFPTKYIASILLSDNELVLNKFRKIEIGEYFQGMPLLSPCIFIYYILRDEINLAYQTYIYLRDNRDFGHFTFKGDKLIMNGILEKNQDEIRRGIELLVSKKVHNSRYRRDPKLVRDIISYSASSYLKLAWILGYEIKIDHPLIPMDLMPISPLKEYTVDYFFIDGYKGEIPESYQKLLDEAEKNKVKSKQDQEKYQWDQKKYRTRQEAILSEQAEKNGFVVKRNDKGDLEFFK